MARLTKLSEKRVWVGFRHPNGTLVVQGFEDVLGSEDNGESFLLIESAEQKAQALVTATKGAQIIPEAKKAEDALEKANEMRL